MPESVERPSLFNRNPGVTVGSVLDPLPGSQPPSVMEGCALCRRHVIPACDPDSGALVAHNMLSLVKAAIATAHEGDEDDLSDYYLADEISGIYRGMMVVLPPVFWRERFGDLGTDEMAQELLDLATDVNWDHYRKNRRGPKRPPPDVGHKNQRNHVATNRVLDEYYVRNR